MADLPRRTARSWVPVIGPRWRRAGGVHVRGRACREGEFGPTAIVRRRGRCLVRTGVLRDRRTGSFSDRPTTGSGSRPVFDGRTAPAARRGRRPAAGPGRRGRERQVVDGDEDVALAAGLVVLLVLVLLPLARGVPLGVLARSNGRGVAFRAWRSSGSGSTLRDRAHRARDRAPPRSAIACTRRRRSRTATRRPPGRVLAGRFAAREATIEALGGYAGRRWQDISVTRQPSGAPAIRLDGNAKRRADALGVTQVLIRSPTRRRTRWRSRSRCDEAGPRRRRRRTRSGDPARAPAPRSDGAGRPRGGAGGPEVAGGAYGRRAVVVCGKGNNGGETASSRRDTLDRFGLRTTVVLLEDPAALREPAASNARRLAEVPGVRVRTFHERGLDRELARGRRRGRDVRDGVPGDAGGRLGGRDRGAQREPRARRRGRHPLGVHGARAPSRARRSGRRSP